MTAKSSPSFISVAAQGEDWREATKAVLDELGDTANKGEFTFGFIYINDQLTENAQSILTLLRSVLGVEHWVGSNGIGVCGSGESFIDKPAISVMLAKFDLDDFCLFPSGVDDLAQSTSVMDTWLKDHTPMLGIIHGDPFAEEDPQKRLLDLAEHSGGFLVGGLSSSHDEHLQFAGDVQNGGVSGVLLSENIVVATAFSQGCNALGEAHVITAGDGYNIRELDGRPAIEVFEEDLATLGSKALAAYPNHPEELEGDICAAFSIPSMDASEYQVRNILKALEDGSMMFAHYVEEGQKMHFVHRDDRSVKLDLCKQLMDLRTRVQREQGSFEPKGALYISCVARAFSQDQNPKDNEMSLIREIIGDIPLAGFYANGEISHGRLYGFTGVLTLFL